MWVLSLILLNSLNYNDHHVLNNIYKTQAECLIQKDNTEQFMYIKMTEDNISVYTIFFASCEKALIIKKGEKTK